MDSPAFLDVNYDRRFGVEIELNSFDGRDFKRNPLQKGELPKGIDYIAHLLMEILNAPVKIAGWHPTHNNFKEWVCKPDSSCGIEICSPANKGWLALVDIERAITGLSNDRNVRIDDRCSLHFHVEVADCVVRDSGTLSHGIVYEKSLPLASILANWIKCEPIFLDSVPKGRKTNRYCPSLGMGDVFAHNSPLDPERLIISLSQKYSTVNTYHLVNGKRATLEFRIMDKEGCINSYLTINWIRLLLHFLEMAKNKGLPKMYDRDDAWTSLLWLDTKDVMNFLGFTGEHKLSSDLEQTRNWFLARLVTNMGTGSGIWSEKGRSVAKRQLDEVISSLGYSNDEILAFLQP
jgi:hypothetical protein